MPLGIKFAYGCQANTYLAAHTWIGFSHILQSPSKVPSPLGISASMLGFSGAVIYRGLALSMEPRPSISLSLDFSRPRRSQQKPGSASLAAIAVFNVSLTR